MTKTKKEPKKVSKVKKTVKPEKVDLKAIEAKREGLINEIRGKLLTNDQLKRGGFGIKGRYGQEVANFNPVIAEINELGAKLGYKPIGLGTIRR